LKEAGAVILRKKKHIVYQLRDGKKFVCAATPSDNRAVLNQIAQLKRLMHGSHGM